MSRFLCPRRMPRRFLILLVGTLLFVILFRMMGSSIDDDEEWYKHPQAYYTEVTCEHDEATMKQFEELAQRMSEIFEKLGITYFLCYGSLWGALKFKSTLPWDRNVDMCVIYHHIAAIDEQTLHQAFKTSELNYYYNSRRGKYVITYKTVSAEVTVFEKVGSHMERVGWEKRIFPHLYQNYQNFPFQLVDKDLSKAKFHNLELPVPHQNYELQKYLYPDNWWKEVKPKGCL